MLWPCGIYFRRQSSFLRGITSERRPGWSFLVVAFTVSKVGYRAVAAENLQQQTKWNNFIDRESYPRPPAPA